MELQSERTTQPGLDHSASRRRRLARVGMALGLSAAVALTGACNRRNTPKVDPAVKKWFEQAYKPATEDMAKAAGASKDVKGGCKAAGDALATHEARLVETPDPQLTESVKGFVAERKEAYTKCAETGDTPSASAKVTEIQRRVNELTAKG